MQVTHVYSSPVANATGTLTIWQGSTTATVAASNLVKPENWNSVHGLIQDIGGNTLGVSSVSGSNIVLAGGVNITLSGVQGANVGSVTIIGGTGEVGTGTTFGGTNISGSMTLNSAGLALSLSGGAGGGGGSINVSAGTTSNNLTNFVMSNSNNVSFGLNGSTITATANARASNDGIGLNTAQTNVTWTVNSSGLSLNAAGYAGTGTTFGGTNISGSITQNSNGIALSLSGLAALTSQSNQALSAANGSFTFQTAQFSNANGVSFVTSAGSAIAASVNTAYVGLNTAQTNVTWTVNSSGISLNAAGYAGTGTTFNGANISGSITQNSVGLNLSLSVAAPGAANIKVSAGTTSNDVTQIVFSNSNGVTFGLDGSTVTASAAGGGGGNTLSFFDNVWAWGGTQATAPGNAQSVVFPVVLPYAVSADMMRFFISRAGNSTSVASTANTTFAWSRLSTWNMVVYVQGTGANSTRIESVSSTSAGSTFQGSLEANTAGSQYTVTYNLTYLRMGSTSNFSNSYATSQTRFDISTTNLTLFTGLQLMDLPFTGIVPASNYWIALGSSGSVISGGAAAIQFMNINPVFIICENQANVSWGQAGLGINSSIGALPGVGSYSIAGGATQASIPFSAISTINSYLFPRIQLQAGIPNG